MVAVRPDLSKTQRRYFTFAGRGAITRVIVYLNERAKAGEPLDANSQVISPDHTTKSHCENSTGKPVLVTSQIFRRCVGSYA